MSNSIRSGGGTLQGWDDLIDTSLENPPDIDPAVLLEGVLSPLALTGSAFFGEGASSSLDLGKRVSDLDPKMSPERIEALFAKIVSFPEITFSDAVGQGPLLPLAEAGLPPSAENGVVAAAAALADGGRSALAPTDLAPRLGKRKRQDDTPLEPPQKKQRGEKVSSHPVAAEWHPTLNEKGPDEYTQGSKRRVWWQCEMEHEWQTRISTRCRSEKPSICPTCANRPVAGSRGLVSAHPVAAEWHPTRNDKGPEEYTQGTKHSMWWQCKSGHEWPARIRDRCRLERPSGCPTCTHYVRLGSRGLLSDH